MRPEKSEVGDTEASGQDEKPVRVWAKVVDIERINPLFPEEAAQELSTQRLSAFDTVISLSREMITAKCTILGKEEKRGENTELRPLTYPLQPASSVYLGDPETVEKLLVSNVPKYRRLKIGHLRGRPEFPAYLDGHAIVARHLAVMATTGAGKTVTVRKILEELATKTRYPILIFDPHSDYLGLKDLADLNDRITVFVPALHLADEDIDNVLAFVQDLSKEELTAPQMSLLRSLMYAIQVDGSNFIETWIRPNAHPNYRHTLNLTTHHFFCLATVLNTLKDLSQDQDDAWSELKNYLRSKFNWLNVERQLRDSADALGRCLLNAANAYRDIRKMSAARVKEGEAVPLPKPDHLANIVRPEHIAIVSLEGYGAHGAAVVANLLRQLLALRLENKVKPFLTVVEEAHNFVPGVGEGVVPSSDILRQIATEGRKYGMGLILISQRPSRVDATVLSQCNSFIILKIINPTDQKYIRDVVETLGTDDAKLLPDLATGEALITGECVRFPILAQVEMPRSRGRHEEEDFIKDFVDDQAADASNSTSQYSEPPHYQL